ncbi:MAG: enoyl-CoA hydratase/isomerase family protein, partial [Synergistales bacterium]|nr:enoyl-CoA hydratase/isomerase family protein [Synergistales bacterium]
MTAILTSISDGIGTVALNRPDAMNTFNTELASGLSDALLAMEADTSVRVVVVTGTGKNFSTGIDLKEYL